MRRVFHILVALLAISICSSAYSQNMKMVDSSLKNSPAWINDLSRGYLISMSSSSDIEEAKQIAITGVKQQIAQSIVSNISVEFLQSSHTVNTNQGSSYTSNVTDVVRSTTDKIPFLQSISLSKIADFYWEKYYDKKSGETRYDYYIKYPFSDAELDKLIAEFNTKQAEINSTIKQMSEALNSFTQIEDIAKNMSTLRALISEFAAEDPRITVVDELVNTYRAQYKYISIEEVEHKDKRIVLQPVLNGRSVTTAQIPTHKSNCADRISKSVTNGVIVVTYDDYVCRSGDDNWIDLTFKFGTIFVTSKIYIIK
ncbi:MAG: hypothetical protein SNI45_02410 [Rikenellaceae bacterium]